MAKTILVVDDDDDVREVAVGIIGVLGYIVVDAADGLTALRLFEQTSVDGVFTDIRMPGMDGFQLAAEVRKRDPRVPIICASGWPGISPDQGGCQEFLRKPYRFPDLAAVLKRLIPA